MNSINLKNTDRTNEKVVTLRDLRKQCNKKAPEVARELGVKIGSYFRYEQGVRQINIRQTLILARLFDCTAEEIIEAQLNVVRSSQEDNRS